MSRRVLAIHVDGNVLANITPRNEGPLTNTAYQERRFMTDSRVEAAGHYERKRKVETLPLRSLYFVYDIHCKCLSCIGASGSKWGGK